MAKNKSALFFTVFLSVAVFPRPSPCALDYGLPGSFLVLAPESQGQALGGAAAVLADGGKAFYYNPARLLTLVKPRLDMAMAWLFAGTSRNYFSFAFPYGKWGFAAGYMREDSGGFEKRINPFELIGKFSVSNEAFLLGGGREILHLSGFSLAGGALVKGVRTEVAGESGFAAGADLAFSAKLGRYGAAAVFRDVKKPEMTVREDSVKYPSSVLLALSAEIGRGKKFRFSPAAFVSKRERQSAKIGAGARIDYLGEASIKIGADSNWFSAGFGLNMGNYSLDYSSLFHEIYPVHSLTFSMKFGVTMEELENYIKKGISKFTREEVENLVSVYARRAEIYREKGDFVKAVRTLETALLWKPGDTLLSGRLRRYKKEMEESMDRQMAERSRLLALQYFEKEDYVVSRQYWQSVLEIDAGNEEALRYIEKINGLMSEREKERLEAEKTEKRKDKFYALMRKASENLKEKKYSLAMKNSVRAISLFPGDSQAKSILAVAREGLKSSVAERLERAEELCRNNRHDEAMKIIEDVLNDDSENREAEEKLKFCQSTLKPVLGREETRKIEQLYYMAVDAYLKNRAELAEKYIKEIFFTDPLNESARKLEEKIKKARALE